LILFFIFSNISLSDWARWIVGKSNLVAYILAELAVILLLVYILWLPETKLKYVNICRLCNVHITFESLACPSCGSEKKVGYCAKGEHWLVECKSCKALTIYGKEKCWFCNKKISRKLECEFCNTAWSIRDWKKLS
jgi:RNA polymerase subunit RPABC4/transcription elongation factor Spt4